MPTSGLNQRPSRHVGCPTYSHVLSIDGATPTTTRPATSSVSALELASLLQILSPHLIHQNNRSWQRNIVQLEQVSVTVNAIDNKEC
mmetsp:Transcript_48240/g.116957  ORF Transcript_48240/g.116957 Transcript_48240/m.116957 type:complete len:87 (+) Transcript_48240:1-261(+)